MMGFFERYITALGMISWGKLNWKHIVLMHIRFLMFSCSFYVLSSSKNLYVSFSSLFIYYLLYALYKIPYLLILTMVLNTRLNLLPNLNHDRLKKVAHFICMEVSGVDLDILENFI